MRRRLENQMTLRRALTIIAAATTTATAIFSLWSSLTSTPDNIDTMVEAMQRAGCLSFWAAIFAVIGAVCTVCLLYCEIKQRPHGGRPRQ